MSASPPWLFGAKAAALLSNEEDQRSSSSSSSSVNDREGGERQQPRCVRPDGPTMDFIFLHRAAVRMDGASFSLSVSLSLTHTHTHTLSLSALLSVPQLSAWTSWTRPRALPLTSEPAPGRIKTARCTAAAAHTEFSRRSSAGSGHKRVMKSAPLLLLLSALLLLSPQLRPAAGRLRVLPGWPDGGGRVRTQLLEELLLRAAATGDAPRLLSGPLLRLLQRRSPAEEEEEEDEEEAPAKRSDEPPLSIDLTFHLLRNMIQMAKMESQRERAQLNRKVLDEVGK